MDFQIGITSSVLLDVSSMRIYKFFYDDSFSEAVVETEMLKRLADSDYFPNLIEYGASLIEGEKVFTLVMDYGGMNFAMFCDIVVDHKDYLPLIYKETLRALSVLEKRAILHNDIKEENVLVDLYEKPFKVKVIDFGCSMIMSEDPVPVKNIYQRLRRPPEALGRKEVVPHSNMDVYALACMLLEADETFTSEGLMLTADRPGPSKLLASMQ